MKFDILPEHRLIGHKDCVYSLLASPQNNHFLSSGGDGLVATWDLTQPTDARLLATCPDAVYSMYSWHISPLLFLGSRKGGLHVIHLEENRELHVYKPSESPIFALSALGNRLFSVHGDGALRIWEAAAHDGLQLLQGTQLSAASLRCLQLSPDGEYLAVGSSDGALRLLDNTGKLVQQLNGHQQSVFSVMWLAGGKYVLSGSRDAHLGVWESSSGKLLERIPAHMFTINDIKHLPELGLVATAGRDKSIKLWNDKSLELIKVADYEKFPGMAHSHSVNKLLWLANSQKLISAGDDRKIIIWAINEN